MTDITERLRSTQNPGLAARQEAADEIERLNAQTLELVREIERMDGMRTMLDERDAEIERLRAELKGVTDQAVEDMGEWIAERDRLRGLLRELRDRLNPDFQPWQKWIARIDAAIGTAVQPDAAPCRVVEYDGAFKCLTHGNTWGAILNPTGPCVTTDSAEAKP